MAFKSRYTAIAFEGVANSDRSQWYSKVLRKIILFESSIPFRTRDPNSGTCRSLALSAPRARRQVSRSLRSWPHIGPRTFCEAAHGKVRIPRARPHSGSSDARLHHRISEPLGCQKQSDTRTSGCFDPRTRAQGSCEIREDTETATSECQGDSENNRDGRGKSRSRASG